MRFQFLSKKRSRDGSLIDNPTTSMGPPRKEEGCQNTDVGKGMEARDKPENHTMVEDSPGGGPGVGPGGPGGTDYPQGSGAPHDKWNGGAKALPSTGLGGSLQNPSSGETSRPGGGLNIDNNNTDLGTYQVSLDGMTMTKERGAYDCSLEDGPTYGTCRATTTAIY